MENKIVNCDIGSGTVIGEPVNLYGAKIGGNCRIAGFVWMEEKVIIGNKCKIKPFVFIPTGVKIEDGVFIGPNVSFTNDRYPEAINKNGALKDDDDWVLEETIVKNGASIGANAVILCGVSIGKNSLVGAGSVVTHDIPDGATVIGNPAKQKEKI